MAVVTASIVLMHKLNYIVYSRYRRVLRGSKALRIYLLYCIKECNINPCKVEMLMRLCACEIFHFSSPGARKEHAFVPFVPQRQIP